MQNDPRSPKSFLTFMEPIEVPEAAQAKVSFESHPSVHLLQSASARSTAGRFLLFESGAIVTYVTGKEGVRRLSELARLVRAKIVAGRLKLIVVTQFDLPNLSKLIRTLGGIEFKHPRAQADRLTELVNRALAAAAAGARLERVVQALAPPGSASRYDRQPPLQTADDCWLVDFESIRRMEKRWQLDALGPPAGFGEWQEVTAPTDESPCWKWVARGPELAEFVASGEWLFYGDQPECRDFVWRFSGERPQLIYVSRDTGERRGRFALNSADRLDIAVNRADLAAFGRKLVVSFDYQIDLINARRTPQSFADFLAIADEAGLEAAPVPISERIPRVRLDYYAEVEKKVLAPKDRLELNRDPAEIRELLDELSGTGAPVLLWTPQQHLKAYAPEAKYYVKSDRIEIPYPTDLTHASFPERIRNSGSKQLFVSAGLRRCAMFFSCETSVLEYEAQFMRLPRPLEIYQIQRRKHFRLPIPAEKPLLIDARNIGELSVKDIGSHGLCLVQKGAIDPAVIFVGQILPEIAFEVEGQVLQCPLEIRWVKVKHTAEGATFAEIGAQFVELPKAVSDMLRLYVLEESLKYLQKYVRIG